MQIVQTVKADQKGGLKKKNVSCRIRNQLDHLILRRIHEIKSLICLILQFPSFLYH